jgi:hypothetical protein
MLNAVQCYSSSELCRTADPSDDGKGCTTSLLAVPEAAQAGVNHFFDSTPLPLPGAHILFSKSGELLLGGQY